MKRSPRKRRIFSLGLMTGTSCDGADLALLEMIHGRGKDPFEWDERLVATASAPFPPALRRALLAAQGGRILVPAAARLAHDYTSWAAALCARRIASWHVPRRRLLIAVHGQTIWHDPSHAISVQLAEPALIAATTGCTTTAAFRQADLAHGGQGAPLVPFYHWLRCMRSRLPLPAAIHNIGGIANLTYITRRRDALIAFDTGPGNALIDLAAAKASGGKLAFDRGGCLARQALSRIDWPRIRKIAGEEPYFRKPPPKSTGRELFNRGFLAKLPGQGSALVANATALTAHTMARAYRDFAPRSGKDLDRVYVAGGGARNPVLKALFAEELGRLTGRDLAVEDVPAHLAPSRYLEAMAFARLGFEALRGRPVSLARVTGAKRDARGAGVFPGHNFPNLLHLVNMA